MPGYQCIFFDLDHTLWDYETNCTETLQVLYKRYELEKLGASSVAAFVKTFIRLNNELWDQYDRGEITRDVIRFERFHRALKEAGIDNYEMSLRLSADYLAESPLRRNVMPQAIETLDYLAGKYPLYIITNGFDEIQSVKVSSAGLGKYFKEIITSERAGHKKPAREIFDFALALNGFRHHHSIMIGDNLLTDMAGARNAGIDHVYFNVSKAVHSDRVTFEISHLQELKDIL